MDTKKLRQKILDLAIRGKLVPQDPNDEPASVLLERIKAEKERLIKEGKIKRSKKTAKTSDTPHYKNVPFEVPNNWIWTTIGGLCSKIGSGSTPKGSNYSSEGVLFFRSQNVYNDGIVLDDIKYISDEVHQSMIGTEVLPNDLLLNITGGSLGRCAIVPNEINKGNVSQHVCILRPITISSNYFHALILSTFFSKSMKITGSGREGLPKYNLEQMMFPLPPLAEQKRIVSEIERWFSLIDIIEKDKQDLHTIIKQAKSKILDLAIHGKLVPQDPNEEPASELLKRINSKTEITCDNAHYTNLPAGWAMCKLSDLCKIENGFAFSSDDYKSHGIPLVRISNITHNTIDITDCAYIEGITDDKFKVSKGDLLIAMSGATTGKMGVYPFDETAYLNQRVGNIKILNKSSLYPNYRNTYMQSKVDEILKIAYGGAQPNISASIIGNFDFPLPPYKEQIRIVETVQRIFDQLDVITESL
ncbi:restriction endonuclease subunit S [Phocaeicola faecicola]|uniref:restriction endonuclease subunit S n=1 Tax=Phocaeicola faecicola TaxID=2739389 RepID=UPI0015E64D52|nr:restriction endonuclease subunit S [Phocaeicola faecicola]